MNNKGQTLIVFVILLPIIFLIMAIVIDLGNLETTKQKCSNEIKSAITYGLNNIESANVKINMETMLNENIEGIKNVNINGQTITINVKTDSNSVFKNIIKNKYDIDITYKGYIENGKIKIVKE